MRDKTVPTAPSAVKPRATTSLRDKKSAVWAIKRRAIMTGSVGTFFVSSFTLTIAGKQKARLGTASGLFYHLTMGAGASRPR